MKNRKRKVVLLTTVLLGMIIFAGCGAKKYPMCITVVNRTNSPIADIRISLFTDEDWGETRIETTLYEGEIAEIDLGEYTQEEINTGFDIQIFGEDGEPIDPDYDPHSNPIFFDNGDWFIFAPPDTGYFMFMDTGYNEAEYDRKIAECYGEEDGRGDVIPGESSGDDRGDVIPEGSSGDGRGDVIPEGSSGDGRGDLIGGEDSEGSVPVLMGGASPFAGMLSLESQNYSDGTYYYEDMTEDSQIVVINTVYESQLTNGWNDPEEYLKAAALDLAGADAYEMRSFYQDDGYTANLGYPVYVMIFTAGGGEDTREWTVYAVDTDTHTYLYAFCATLDGAEDMWNVYLDVFDRLYLSD